MPHAKVTSRFQRRSRALGVAITLVGSLALSAVIARPVEAATGDITEFALPSATSGPQNITTGADGNLWFTEQNAGKIGTITPSGVITEYTVPTGVTSLPNGIALGPDGNIWFTEYGVGKIGKITPSGSFTEYTLPAGATSGPRNIALGPDGNMWFTEYTANNIGRITTSGTITEYALPLVGTTKPNPRGIIAGPDGNIWFTEYTGDQIGYMNPSATSPLTTLTLYPVPTASSGPRSIDVGPDGNLWFTENNSAKVGRITPAGVITEFPTTATPGSIPARMTAGADGNMYFTENQGNKIGQILPGSPNTITEFTIPTANSAPVGITNGPDHNIWFAENGAGKIGRLAVVLNTTTGLGSSANPSLFGTPVTFTATVSPASSTGTVTFLDNGSSIGTGTLSAGTATLTTSTLTVGSHPITATYGGDTFNLTSTTLAPVTQVVQSATTTGVGSSENPSTYGDSVTFTATVTPPTATGLVTFFDSGISIGTGALSTSGGVATATLTTTALAVGSHTITAAYGGDTDDASSNSTGSPLSQGVNQVTTGTILISGPDNPSQNGEAVTFTATVSSTAATGTVTFDDFYDGVTSSIGTGTLSGGVATLTTSSLGVGAHSITAVYGGDTDDAGSSSSPPYVQTVNPGNTTTVLGTSLTPTTYGDPVTFTATVTPDTATGTVTFDDLYDGSTTVIGTGTLNGSGVATLDISTLSGGSHSITAVYGGDTNNDGSPSSPITQQVNPLDTTTGLGTSGSPTTYGDPVTFTATVLPATATGTVTFNDFYDGSTTVIGTGALNGSGVATLDISTLSGGSHSITAVYGGDPDDASSPSSPVTQQVNTLATTTGVVSGLNPSSDGQSVTFTATVLPSTATGTVTFFADGTSLGTGTLASGSTTLTTSSLTVGSHSITAVYGGDVDDTGSPSTSLAQVVQAVSATELGSGENPSSYGDSVTLTASVTPSTATGTITFYDGSTSLGTGTLSGGSATLSIATLAVGSHPLTASYGGDSGDTTSTSTQLSQVVNQDTNTVVVSSSLNPAPLGQTVTFTATVTPSSATGTVTFNDGSSPLATERVTAGVATFPTSSLSSGNHSITAVYSGDTDDLGGTSSPMTQQIESSKTTITIASSVNPAKVGQKITFTAKLTPSSITGKVTFKDGTKTLGTGTLRDGVATFSTSTLTVGTHEITAVYAGTKAHPGATSSKLAQKVEKKVKVVLGPVSASASVTSTTPIDRIARLIDDRGY